MKIAFVGKGGSGKSSMSWLFTHVLAQEGIPVLAIDADHNMDLVSNLGAEASTLPSVRETHERFRTLMNLKSEEGWSSIAIDKHRNLPKFTLTPQDEFTASLVTTIDKNIQLMNVGLGSEEAIYSGRCAHGNSNPLKYYLPLLDEGGHAVIIDSVAGTDMLNFGLYAGVDAIVGVVEPHRNSVKVFGSIIVSAELFQIPAYAILNKPSTNPYHEFMRSAHKERIIGEMPFDNGVSELNPEMISGETKNETLRIWEVLKGKHNTQDAVLKRLARAELLRQGKLDA